MRPQRLVSLAVGLGLLIRRPGFVWGEAAQRGSGLVTFGCRTAASFAEAFVASLGKSVRAPCWNVMRLALTAGLSRVQASTGRSGDRESCEREFRGRAIAIELRGLCSLGGNIFSFGLPNEKMRSVLARLPISRSPSEISERHERSARASSPKRLLNSASRRQGSCCTRPAARQSKM